MATLKVLTYNIHKGFSSNNRRFVLDRIRAAIRTVHADLVLLQEVLGEHTTHARKVARWPIAPQFEFLADELWPHFAYGRNSVYTAGHHGNAILSKYPLTFFENIDISTNRLEQRGLLHATISYPNLPRPIHAICVHLGLLESERRVQLRRICDRIESHVPHADPLVIAGDFNDWRVRANRVFHKNLDVVEAFSLLHGAPARTFPAWLPALRLDRIYCRRLEPLRAQSLSGRPWRELSDHAAIFAELEIA